MWMCLCQKSKDSVMWCTCDTAHDLSHQSALFHLLLSSWKQTGSGLGNTVQLMKFSSSMFSFCFWWPILEIEGSLTSWDSVPPACYFLLPSQHRDRPAICHLLQLQSSLFDRVVQLCGTPLPDFRYKDSFFCLLIRSEKDITAIVIYLSLSVRRVVSWWHEVKGQFICRCLEHGLRRNTLALGLGSVLACPFHILSQLPPL